MNLTDIKHQISKLEGQKDLLNTQIIEAQSHTQRFSKKLGIIERVQAFLQVKAKETQGKVRYQIQDIVQLALDTCFPDKYEFQIEFKLRRNKVEVDLFLDNNGEPTDPMDENGGGIVDIVCFALRIAMLTLSKNDRLLILDEPFKNLSVSIRPLACQILRRLSKRLKLQILCVTHDASIIDIADKVFEVDQKNGRSLVSEGK